MNSRLQEAHETALTTMVQDAQEQTAVTGATSSHFYPRYGKRLLDFFLAMIILLLCAPIVALIASLVALDSPGSPIFAQERIGRNGKRFRCYKFRTMYENCDSKVHKQHIERIMNGGQAPAEGESLKLKNDPRITRVGAFLRRSSLDELPQFFNVLKGDMSIVGPRPEVPYALATYKPWYYKRFKGRPGITGYWQVTARNLVSYEQMIRMDIEYHSKQSLGFDVALMLKTPLAMLSGRGAG